MQIKQVKNILQEISVFALILLAFTCFLNINQEASAYQISNPESDFLLQEGALVWIGGNQQKY
jgi:hypothetical protein